MSARIIDTAACARALALRDLTDAARGPHAMQLLVHDAIAALSGAWHCSVLVYRAPPVIGVADNYDRLHYPHDAAARDSRYTRYVGAATLLRTQTSAMVPEALRLVGLARYDDVLVACPGLTYRRDSIDRLHTGEPHQLDLWRIARAPLGERALAEMIERLVHALLPGREYRTIPATHPYTVAGRQVDVRDGDAWVEIAECGLALPAMLDEAGIDTAHCSGLALGVGLDRALMLRKGIPDIRLLRSSDPRVAAQMTDLAPYRRASSQPLVRRDLSIATAADTTSEELGDRVRAALGADADSVETIAVTEETPYEALPPAARDRLGIRPGQKNVLLRVVLRHLERTLTAEEANRLRDRIYMAVHEGDVWLLAARNP